MTDALAGVKVGDELYEFGSNWTGRADVSKLIVTKVARKLITASVGGEGGWTERKFYIETGNWNDRNWGHSVSVMTPAAFEDMQYRTKLTVRLKEAGLEFKFPGTGKGISTARLERVVEILENDEEPVQGE